MYIACVYSGYKIIFDGKGGWGFGIHYARNIIIFGDDNSSSSHTNHTGCLLYNFLILGERDTFGINGSFGTPEKTFGINFSKTNTTFCLRLQYNADNNYLLVNGLEIFKFKPDNKNVNFPTQFSLGSISNGFSGTEYREVSLTGPITILLTNLTY